MKFFGRLNLYTTAMLGYSKITTSKLLALNQTNYPIFLFSL